MHDKKTVLITGGNKGIGLDTSKLFVDAGYAVVVLARDFKNFPLQGNPAVQSVEYDLADIEGIPQLITSLPPIDVLVNNAGIMYALPYDGYPAEKVEQILNVNMKAPVALITEVSKNMVAKGAGRIVNNASIAGEIGHPDVWYGITKAGMINITKSFAKILGPQGVVVNAVAPGPAETEMLATIPEPRKRAIKSAVYTGRFAYPQEVARAMFWLATDCPEYINGTCIDINNGAFPR
ncbi:SDR family oxidoreductase [Desulfobulbus rhabdoformis]|uniref:SDR family NAD(P)-dependent oxidoreductase n=1 Tax=Desulfobulbus rhabdoformis TaxID=34032 RepID=UPI001962F915|nr:SDR family oxidoreductase [Desulfobulbus rhabdoformis]MBM9616467.1 SDR family oxidoreductase [Desulfobulbus rhabdoformis]